MNKYLFIALAMAMGLSARAQISFQKVIRVGVKAGITGSVFTRDVEPFDPRIPGYYENFDRYVNLNGYGGITLDYEVTARISLGAELLYSAKGMAYWEENNGVVFYDEDGNRGQAHNVFYFDIDYVELPITLNVSVLRPEGKVWLKAYGGMARGAAVYKKTKITYPEVGGYDQPGDAGKKELQHVRTFNTSVIGGLKVGSNKRKSIFPYGDLRGSYMLQPVFNRKKADTGGNLDTRMFSLSLGLGVQF